MHVPLMAFHVPFTVNFLLSIKKHAWFNVNWIGVMVRKGTLPEDSESMGSNPDLINCFFPIFFLGSIGLVPPRKNTSNTSPGLLIALTGIIFAHRVSYFNQD